MTNEERLLSLEKRLTQLELLLQKLFESFEGMTSNQAELLQLSKMIAFTQEEQQRIMEAIRSGDFSKEPPRGN